MIELGRIQKLKLDRIAPQGAYLTDAEDEGKGVLLPRKQVPENAKKGDELSVFVYRDSDDRLISTTAEPLLTAGKVARLKINEVTRIGAFLDMGLERDLLLPFAQQTYRAGKGNYVLVAMYTDKSDRLAATMKVYDYLPTASPYKEDDEVEGLVYEISRNFGAFVAVDYKYSALIPARELPEGISPGAQVKARVSRVHEDGKLDLSVRKKAYLQLDDDAELIIKYLSANGGSAPLGDKAAPEAIRETFHMSKAAFKRAAGHLMKEGRVSITEDSITLKESK